MRVLIVEDQPEVADLLSRALREVAWATDVVGTGSDALQALAATEYDLAVLDVGLPDLDGFSVCRQWRKLGGRTPILILTARGELSDRVIGLDSGADDYLPKPFAIEELLARLRALARRPATALDVVLQIADLGLDTNTRAVRRAGRAVSLTAREFAMLEYLMRNAHRVVSRGQILAGVWDDNFDPVGNSVDVLVSRIRRKIEAGEHPRLLHTVRGGGYVLSDRVFGDAT
jgi:DNA-binding response OmpR family regulator